MSGLSAEDREALAVAAHATACHLVDGESCGEADEFDIADAAILAPAVEAIVARHVKAALTEAADDMESFFGTDDAAHYWAQLFLRQPRDVANSG